MRRACMECTMDIDVSDNTGHKHGCPNGDNPGHATNLGACPECGWQQGRHAMSCQIYQQQTAHRRT